MNPLQHFYYEQRGPFGNTRICRGCGHGETVRTGIAGVGRGYGMREGNKARGRMIQHVKRCSRIREMLELAKS